jgi:hypothetical protein
MNKIRYVLELRKKNVMMDKNKIYVICLSTGEFNNPYSKKTKYKDKHSSSSASF